MHWSTAAEWRAQLAAEASAGDPPAEQSKALGNRLLWLGRFSLTAELQDQARRLRATPLWDVELALQLSLAWLLAGDGRAADHAFLEADQLDPALRLVPDPWGLWPAPEQRNPPPPLQSLVDRFHAWRWLEPQALWATFRPELQADWRVALSGDGLDRLVLALRHGSAIDPPMEPLLAELVGDDALRECPGEARRFWGLLADLVPQWTHARIKAADLALAAGEHPRVASWLQEAGEESRGNPWYWDISARQALALGSSAEALDHWLQAIAVASEAEAELFRQRRREARRGPALLQARALLAAGDTTACLNLLRPLVDEDPQWQPLRSLLREAEAAAPSRPQPGATEEGSAFAQLLDRAASRLGVTLPEATAITGPSGADADAARRAAEELEAFATFLAQAEARFALQA